ncbi:LuxR C-terminal-related transcriptional regulator [Amnibacterium sp.]|uniref:LuxR C-terminal-related transcriptional regulator n=1 Tax=Amnibacterium sp. TaxID=1872496 RepID=UPI002620DA98|nr:LuxR C-terminal-related transcriptional regulator [Amnibacterium sp.]MCU1472530.1 ATP-dependent transcriptional regulator, MalT-like, LuxR family (Modular protein) [Amnibacterium sp.]
MSGQLLESKLHMPTPRRDLISRARLTERLERGVESRLTLVSAPAGFGKTTLLATWLGAGAARPGDPRSVAWLSLDQDDDESGRFWTALIAALGAITTGFASGVAAMLRGPQPPPVRMVLTDLLNELAAVDHDVVVVLDDYHLIESLEIRQDVAFLVDRLPPRIHLVLAARADPAMPLARLRARGELTEIRAADLRFTTDEVSAYLSQAMGRAMPPELVAALAERTEGWIAALQLAALSMQGREDVGGFVRAFSGNDRFVVDYLVEEVLQSLPEAVAGFLLETSVLRWMTGPLCDAVTGRGGGRAMLERLERENLFLIPLDDDRRSYRYHHLFADLLQARLLDERPERARGLHLRASGWYAGHGDLDAAVHHALAAGDPDRAAELIEPAVPALRRERGEATIRTWLERLPVEVMRARPVLSVGYAGALLAVGQVDRVESLLRDAERCLPSPPMAGTGSEARPDPFVVVDREEFDRLPAAIAVYRAGLALMLGDSAETVAQARRALRLVHPDDHVRRGAAAALLGLAAWGDGDLEAAYDAYVQCSASLLQAGYLADVLGCATTLADIRITQGRLREAMQVYDRALRLAADRNATRSRGVPDLHVGMSAIHAERGDLRAAKEELGRAREVGEVAGMPRYRYRYRVAEALVREIEGDVDGALALLDEAERDYVADFAPDVRPVQAVRARLLLRLGRVDDALDWAHRAGISATDGLDYMHEYDHVTFARCLLAQHRRAAAPADAAKDLLKRLLAAAESGGRTGTVIEVLVLLAVAGRSSRDQAEATLALDRALKLAEPEGYFQVFADEAESLEVLLRAAAHRGTSERTVRRLLSRVAGAARTPLRSGSSEPVEQLSGRERDVLRLLKTDLSGPEIARELVVSINTVRTHTKNIYAKLGVSNRRAAVIRAAEVERVERGEVAERHSF